MKIHKFEFNVFGENTYVVYDENTLEAAIIDPGMMSEHECIVVDRYIAEKELKLKYLLNTHLHIDHVAGVSWIINKYHLLLSASIDDNLLSERVAEQAKMFHLQIDVPNRIEIGNPLRDNDILTIGDDALIVIAVPGHSPGGLAFYSEKSKSVFTGDSLFYGSIGRTDLLGGNYGQLISSIQKRLLTLPSDTKVYPGHGPATSIDNELKFNPFL